MNILVADDDAVSRLVLTAHLKRLGHDVVTAEDGREAWGQFLTHRPPVVITDWLMPEIDGLELCRMIRGEKRARYTYLILLTSLGGKGSYLEGMNAGADDFVTKPFDAEELVARLRVGERILGLQAEVRQLQGLLPICAYCKRIRDETNVWHPIDHYLATHTDASFSHGICPTCFEHEVTMPAAR